MSGRTELFTYAIALISLVAIITDLIRGRIFNWLTLPAFVAGLVASTVVGGLSGMGQALLGAGVGLLLFGWVFWVGAIGGGDVKFLMALGAWGGYRYIEEVALLSLLVGGIMALALIIFSGRLPSFSRRMYRFLQSIFIRELEVEAPAIDRAYTMPFGIPIAVAAVWVAISSPLARLGVQPWP